MTSAMQGILVDVARVAAWLFLLTAIFVPLERLFAERPQPVVRRQLGVDLGYFLGNGIVTAALLSGIIASLAVMLHRLLPGGLTAWIADLPLWVRLAAILVISEFGSYWGHRWSHEVPFLWRFHAIHHSAEQVDWLTNTRAHPVDMIFTRLCGLFPVYLLGLAQAGTGPQGLAAPLLIMLTTLWGFFIHANVRWRFGWLEAWIATPAFHRWHHTNDVHRNHNYASTLPIYDRLFGTLYLPRDTAPPVYGIDAPMPAGLVGQLLSPVRLDIDRYRGIGTD